MRVAVAGGNGFIGRHVVQALRAAGHEARVLARSVSPSDDRPGVEHHAVDLGAAPVPAEVLEGCDAVVNLVGIKAPRGDNDFDRAHLQTVRHLAEGARAAGIERLVHVSVAQAEGSAGGYAQTKRQGEALARDCGLAVTILRPGLVYGVGDEPLRNLIQMVRLAPVVPVPSAATGPLPAIDVLDVAAAVVATLERPQTIGRTIDLVGPQALDLRGLVRCIADALQLPTVIPPLPQALARLGVATMEAVLLDPLITRSQLEMLTRGLPGDPEAAQRELGVTPRPLTPERIREVAEQVPPLLPSLRLVTSIEHRRWIRERADGLRGWPWLLLLAMAAMLGLPHLVPQVWTRMAVVEGGLALVVLLTLRRAVAPLLRPRAAAIGLGLACAALLYLLADLLMMALRGLVPELAAQVQEIYAWNALAPLALRLGLLPLIVFGEDLLWRGVFLLPLAARAGPLVGCLLAGSLFALAHLGSGPPLLLLAAVGMGSLWCALALRSRSLVPVITCHLAWDLLVMFVRPP